jgi:hypothetical protein
MTRPHRGSTRPLAATGARCAACLALVLLGAAAEVAAQPDAPARDPTVPPLAAASSAASLSSRAAQPSGPASALHHLMVVDGRRFVIDGERRLGVGDPLVGGHIERIDETAVWVRDARSLRQLSLYTGVLRRPVATNDSAAASPTAASAPRPASPVLAKAVPTNSNR